MKTSGPIALAASLLLSGSAHARELLKPMALGSDDYAESFSFVGDMEDGTYVLLQLGVSNLGPGSGRGICRGLVVPPTEAVWTENTLVGQREWGHRTEGGEERLQIGACTGTLDARGLAVTVALGEGKATLRFPSRPQPVSPPGFRIQVGKGQHRSELWYGGGPVDAELALPGRPPRVVHGRGYADHGCSDADPGSVARQWVRFRALGSAPVALVQLRRTIEGGVGSSWVRTAEAFTPLEGFSVERSGDESKPNFKVRATGPEGRVLTIESDRFVYRYSPIAELGVFGRALAPFVGAPITFTTRATLRDGDRTVTGLLEIEEAP